MIDPRTGRPAEGVRSASVVASDAATADALATAVLVGAAPGPRVVRRPSPDAGPPGPRGRSRGRSCVVGTRDGVRDRARAGVEPRGGGGESPRHRRGPRRDSSAGEHWFWPGHLLSSPGLAGPGEGPPSRLPQPPVSETSSRDPDEEAVRSHDHTPRRVPRARHREDPRRGPRDVRHRRAVAPRLRPGLRRERPAAGLRGHPARPVHRREGEGDRPAVPRVPRAAAAGGHATCVSPTARSRSTSSSSAWATTPRAWPGRSSSWASSPRPPDVLKQWITEMADRSIPMLHDAVEAFVTQDAELAEKAMEAEPAVDALKRKFNAEVIDLVREQKIPPEAIAPLMTIGRRFERVADQARNVCMEVLYMCTGELAKHKDADTIRILFVDEHNSCRSQIAEAIANCLDQEGFAFASAGLEPGTIDEGTLELLKEKGLDVTRLAPKYIYQVPDLDKFQVTVGLAERVQEAFPRTPRKMVYVDWSLADPSQVEGSPEEMTGGLRGRVRVPLEPHPRAHRGRPRQPPRVEPSTVRPAGEIHEARSPSPIFADPRRRRPPCRRRPRRVRAVGRRAEGDEARNHHHPEQGLRHHGERGPGVGREVPVGGPGRRGRGLRGRLRGGHRRPHPGRGRHRQRQPGHEAPGDGGGGEEHRQEAAGVHGRATTPWRSTSTRTTRSTRSSCPGWPRSTSRAALSHDGHRSVSRSPVSRTTPSSGSAVSPAPGPTSSSATTSSRSGTSPSARGT